MELTMDELRGFLANGTGSAQENPQPVVEETPPAPQEEPQQVDIVENPTHEDKDNEAFARMRVENKTMSDALMTMAGMLGIKANDVNDAMAKLSEANLQRRSEESGISKEILARLDAQDKELAEYRAQRQQQQLTSQLIAVRDKYGLTNEELTAFAKSVDAMGVDYSRVNLSEMYQNMNFDKIVQARVDRAVQEALAKSTEEGTSNISLGSGGAVDNVDGPSFKTAADLETFLRNARR